MLKRFNDIALLYAVGNCNGNPLTLFGLDNLLNKNIIIKDIKIQLYVVDPVSGSYKKYESGNEKFFEPQPHYLDIKINDTRLFDSNVIEGNYSFDNINLFVEDLKTFQVTSQFLSENGEPAIRVYFYCYKTLDNFDKAKQKMIYDH